MTPGTPLSATMTETSMAPERAAPDKVFRQTLGPRTHEEAPPTAVRITLVPPVDIVERSPLRSAPTAVYTQAAFRRPMPPAATHFRRR